MSVLPQQDPYLADDPAQTAPDPHRALPPDRTDSPDARRIQDPHHLLPAHATDTPRKGGKLRLLLVVLVLLLATAFVVWRIRSNNKQADAQANRAAAAANRPIPVQVVAVQQRTVPVFLTALGTVTAYNTVTLHSRVDGQLLQVNFREGQVVRKGQLLIEIDPRPYQAVVDQALGTLAKDEANQRNLQAEAQRYTALYEAGVVSKEQQQLQASNSGQAAGTIKADQAAIEAARVNLGYTKIYSPIDGVVGLRQVDVGNIVKASDTNGLVVITQVHPIAVIFTLPEDQLPQVQAAMKSGNKLVVEAYDRSDAHKIAAGTLLTIDNQIDTTTGTAKLKAVFDNSDGSLFANQFVNVRLILRDRPNAIVVPSAAIESGTQGDYVYVVNPGPTPENKRKNLPNGGGNGAGAGGRSRGSRNATGSSGSGTQPGTTATDTTGEAGGAGSHGNGSGRAEGSGRSRAQFHADAVPVHVDFTIGTMSVLAEGGVHAGQQVVVDGQEKLVDGGNVSPQQARSVPSANANTGIGAGSSSPATAQQGTRGSTSGNPNAQRPGQDGQTSSPSAAPSNGAGRP